MRRYRHEREEKRRGQEDVKSPDRIRVKEKENKSHPIRFSHPLKFFSSIVGF